jgi:hypothetical protein
MPKKRCERTGAGWRGIVAGHGITAAGIERMTRPHLLLVSSCSPFGSEGPREYTAEDYERLREMSHAQMMSRIRNKDRNMTTRLERRRKAIRGRWMERGWIAGCCVAGLVVIPLLGAGISLAWNAFWLTVLN